MSELNFKIRPADYTSETDLKEVEFIISILIDLVNKKKMEFQKEEQEHQARLLKARKSRKKKTLLNIVEPTIEE